VSPDLTLTPGQTPAFSRGQMNPFSNLNPYKFKALSLSGLSASNHREYSEYSIAIITQLRTNASGFPLLV
jgi:hypothetical protein